MRTIQERPPFKGSEGGLVKSISGEGGLVKSISGVPPSGQKRHSQDVSTAQGSDR
jgi:hypothetical protein